MWLRVALTAPFPTGSKPDLHRRQLWLTAKPQTRRAPPQLPSPLLQRL